MTAIDGIRGGEVGRWSRARSSQPPPGRPGAWMRRPPDAPSRQAGGRRAFEGGGRIRCPTTTPTQTGPRVVGSRTGGGCLTAMPSPAGYAGSETASSAARPAGFADWDGDCGGGHGGVLKAGAPAASSPSCFGGAWRASGSGTWSRRQGAVRGPVSAWPERKWPSPATRSDTLCSVRAPRRSATFRSAGRAGPGRPNPGRPLARRPGARPSGGWARVRA
jgi:hypothetical protein